MSKYIVAITNSIVVHVEVEASSAKDARSKVEDYGAIEAISDFKLVSETAMAKIGSIVKAAK